MKPYVLLSILGAAAIAFAALPRAGGAAPAGCTAQCTIADTMGSMHMGGSTNAAPADMSMNPHMKMLHSTAPSSSADRAKADAILSAIRITMAKYTDYRAAERDGYVPFLANIPQPMYHFTNWANAAVNNTASFDPARPTSLIYAAVPGGYKLEGAMYTAPASASVGELNDRVPITIGTWHEHVNVCFPPPGQGQLMLDRSPKFGLAGSIATPDACTAAGGTFKPLIFNWMLHVWPYETGDAAIWKATAH